MAAVFPVQVLDDLFTTLVFEVDVDVGRFVALAADEALEQHAQTGGVDLGDAERIADRRVGSRAPALTKNVAAAGEVNDVGHCEEIRLVAQLADQREFVFDLLAHRGRNACRIAAR